MTAFGDTPAPVKDRTASQGCSPEGDGGREASVKAGTLSASTQRAWQTQQRSGKRNADRPLDRFFDLLHQRCADGSSEGAAVSNDFSSRVTCSHLAMEVSRRPPSPAACFPWVGAGRSVVASGTTIASFARRFRTSMDTTRAGRAVGSGGNTPPSGSRGLSGRAPQATAGAPLPRAGCATEPPASLPERRAG